MLLSFAPFDWFRDGRQRIGEVGRLFTCCWVLRVSVIPFRHRSNFDFQERQAPHAFTSTRSLRPFPQCHESRNVLPKFNRQS